MITLTYEFRLKPTKQQSEEMGHILDVCRSVWNYALRERKDWSASRKCPINACSIRSEYIMAADAPYPNFAAQCKSLTQAKKGSPWLQSVNAQVLQQVLKTLDKAHADMKKLGRGFPRFKQPNRMRSFVFPQLGKQPLGDGVIKLPSLGAVKFRQSRPYPDGFDVKQARIVKRASGFYLMLSFQSDVSIPDVPLRGSFVGVDIGLEYFLSTSEGAQVERPKFFVSMQRKLKLLQRRLKGKQLGSANWKKQQRKVARLHERIANNRKDFHYKQAHALCDAADVVVVEDLNLIGLSRGFLGKHMLDAGHGQFLNQILPWVCFKRGKGYLKEPAAGTSQECPQCGAKVRKGIGDRWHHCECGCSMPRDIASGIVIKQRALGRRVLENAC
ncbi:MAG: RNA-guided endonuclease InsQ/TnpB family protein [Phormidesmis sp.]